MPISGPKGLRQEAKFPPVFILIPGFKVQGSGKSKDFEGFIKGQSGRIRQIKKVPVATLRKSQNAKVNSDYIGFVFLKSKRMSSVKNKK